MGPHGRGLRLGERGARLGEVLLGRGGARLRGAQGGLARGDGLLGVDELRLGLERALLVARRLLGLGAERLQLTLELERVGLQRGDLGREALALGVELEVLRLQRGLGLRARGVACAETWIYADLD